MIGDVKPGRAFVGVDHADGEPLAVGERREKVAERNRYSRWRRLPPVFRSGEHRVPGYEDEAQRLTLYLPGGLLDLAEDLAELADVPTIQEYCARLLALALENERARWRVADEEAKRGPLEGLRAIAGDPAYLAEWRAQDGARERDPDDAKQKEDETTGPALTVPVALEPSFLEPEDMESTEESTSAEVRDRPTVRVETSRSAEPVVTRRITPELIDGRAMDTLWKHVGPGDQSAGGFLPRLRRGESIPADEVAELLDALRRLEDENRNAEGLDRRFAYALYRLALESQVLMTEVWPRAFDEPTVDAVRSVQEMVERILSGEDVRFYADPESQVGETRS